MTRSFRSLAAGGVLVALAACGGKADSGSPAPTDTDTDVDTDTDTDVDTDVDTDADTDTSSPELAFALDAILDVNAVVATKGLDVTEDGSRVYLWDYNQDQLQVWDGAALSTVATGLVTSYGTDLAVDSLGQVYVSKGGSATGETIMKWDGVTGEAIWGSSGVLLSGALLLGLDVAILDGVESVYAADGATGSVLVLETENGAVVDTVVVAEAEPVVLYVAAAPDGTLYVLTSAVSNPVTTGDPVYLRHIDGEGEGLHGPVAVEGAIYLTLGSDGLVYVSQSSFELPSRQVSVFDGELAPVTSMAVPESYVGFLGGIATYGEGDAQRVLVLAQEGEGSEPICDVLSYGWLPAPE